jgi:hypothetical protein
MARKPASKTVERAVLMASRRRCCACAFLHDRYEVRKGQIAHLNRNPADSRFENLVFLFLEHHDEYDSQPSQSKGFSPQEIREYRDRLYARFKETPTSAQLVTLSDSSELDPLPKTSEYAEVRARFAGELAFINKPWRYPLWQLANEPELFAYKAGNRADGVCLIERIDLPDGRVVIACMAIAGNPGNSITNCVEDLCFQVCERFEIPASRLVWLEHYDYYDEDEWSMVEFRRMPPERPFEDPTWTPMTPELWRDLRLKPKKRLQSWDNSYKSKLTKLFPWPDGEQL